ncbi:hypothetical protein CK203_064107 [Vitis vinifera]|uniref:Uncharacterized protein n=1 Tax=Vitis vinifera TaxID=29760 RepID=A0A438G5G5_VITVI|nr:hypothetical protein CK203_064107 [Vitis vinifera]
MSWRVSGWVGRDARLQGFWVTYTLPRSSLGGNPRACGFWDPVIERISRRLDGWQKVYLSLELDGHIVVLGRLLHKSPRVFQVYSVCGRRWGKNSVLGRLVVGGPTFGGPISKTT